MSRWGEFTAAQARHLLSGRSNTLIVGPIVWTAINGTWRGRAECLTVNMPGCVVVLELQVRPSRPSEPTVVLNINGSFCRRVDVNGAHRTAGQLARWTHVQGRDSPDEPERLMSNPPEWFPDVPFGTTVAPDVYHQVFVAAARLFEIDASGLSWDDPPKEAP